MVLDDAADIGLRKSIEALAILCPNVYYYARTKVKGVPHHYKAGNLMGGTDFVTKLEGGPGEYIAALDADMIPEPEWLRGTFSILSRVLPSSKLTLTFSNYGTHGVRPKIVFGVSTSG